MNNSDLPEAAIAAGPEQQITAAQGWFVYMIFTSDGQVYTGITTDMRRRWQQHSAGKAGARYFRGRKPQQLCYLEDGHNRTSASRREYAIKTLSASDKRHLIQQCQSEFLQRIATYELTGLPHATSGSSCE